jgi:putative methyltransferase (TIGR04325 family)
MNSDQLTFSTKAKLVVKEIVPPFLWKILKKLNKSEEYGFFGDYSSWEEAMKDSVGYDSDIILEKVKNSLLQVKEGKAIYERDSVLFDKIEYSFPVLAALLKIALENDGKLSILDFGGSLGSSYYQCKDFLGDIKELHWSIVEQPNFVECGKQYFENDQLKFYEDIETCLQYQKPDVILLSSVIQYLEKPYEFLEDLLEFDFSYILIDRTIFLMQGKISLAIHIVNPSIYKASIPTWFLDLKNILKILLSKYDLILSFDSFSGKISWNNNLIEDKGFFYKKR